MRTTRTLAIAAAVLLGAMVCSPIASAEGALDQSDQNPNGFYYLTSDGHVVGQSFTAGVSGLLTHVELTVQVPSTPATPFTLTLYRADGGLPSGASLATSVVPASAFPIVKEAWIDFVFPTPASVTAGTRYVLIESMGGSGQYWIDLGSGNYQGGTAVSNVGTGWTLEPAQDLLFRTYVLAVGANGPAPAPVLQQFELSPSGARAQATCESEAAATLNWGGTSSGGWGSSWAEWANGGQGGPVCTRTLAYASSTAKWSVQP